MIHVDGEINEIHTKTLDVCKNDLAILATLAFPENSELASYTCKRVCNSTGVVTEFIMEFLTFEEERTNVIQFMHRSEENSYEFFRKTVNQIKCLSDVNDEEVIITFDNDLTTEEIEQEWLVIARHFSTDTGLRIFKSLVLTGVHVPQQVLDVVVASCKKVTLDFLICLIAIFKKCKDYTLDRNIIYNLLTEASNLDELHKHQLAILLHLWKTQCITYGDGISVESEWTKTRRILDIFR
jgi:hypothetical protein